MAASVLPAVWEIPQVIRARLGDQAGRQRAMFHEGHLLLVLHAPPGPDDVERKGRFFWREPNGTWHSTEQGAGKVALSRHIDEYADLLERLDLRWREAKSAEEYFAVLNAAAPLHHASRNMHHTLQEARETVPAERDLINYRDRAYAVERTAELLCDDTKNALDFAVARRAEEQARSSHHMAVSAHRLNLLAAFFFPIATLSAIFGMELRNGLNTLDTSELPLPFLGVLGVGLLGGLLLSSFVTRGPQA
jgi:hypothetical protein